MEGSAAEDLGAPESWEVADLEESVSRLMLSKPTDASASASASSSALVSDSSLADLGGLGEKDLEDVVAQVDQFLREALENPRERLSILRMEQDVEKFIRDPSQQQIEFQQLPTSYLRLAAHRVAQHYSLQSMVLLDNNFPDGSGSRIIVRKTAECRPPLIRLADIPVNLPAEETSVTKVAIKQRPQKRYPNSGNGNSGSSKGNSSRSVEERKEEYNKARARIFSGNSSSSGDSRRSDNVPRVQDTSHHHGSLGVPKVEERAAVGISEISPGRGIIESSNSSGRTARNRAEEPIGRYNYRPNNRVAIFRDREIDRKDPDYNRNYDRYVQRFDPGFGFSGGPYTIQPMYAPAINYNTEFPQLGSAHRPMIPSEAQPCPMAQRMPGQWAGANGPAGMAYPHPEALIAQFNPNHVGPRSTSGVYMHSSPYPCQRPGVPFAHPHDHVYQPFSQSHQQPDASFGTARPR